MVLKDNVGNTYFATKPWLSLKQQRWQLEIARFDLTWVYRKGKENMSTDVLSRKVCTLVTQSLQSEFLDEIRKATETDQQAQKRSQQMAADPTMHRLHFKNGIWYFKQTCVYVPEGLLRTRVMVEHHDCALAAHSGQNKTQMRIARQFYWPTLAQDVLKYVQTWRRTSTKDLGTQSGSKTSAACPDENQGTASDEESQAREPPRWIVSDVDLFGSTLGAREVSGASGSQVPGSLAQAGIPVRSVTGGFSKNRS
ncbi:hypothetical protein R1flu_007612 [Riccia fluitans]|uniref:Integrase zinc-binding domain-containing protein n=1 Tax=Riccia fluitans TaxID=41844 RepID=A0ABD1YZL0_9MARC